MGIFLLALGGLIAAAIGWMIVRAVRMTLASTAALQQRIEPVQARVFSRFEPFDARSAEEHLSAMEQVTGPPPV